MIVLNIQSDDRKQLDEAAELLLKERLVIDINIRSDIERYTMKEGKVDKRMHHVMRARTKSLLFPTIEKLLRTQFKINMPELFSVPIIHMDWDQTLQLRDDLEEV